MKMLDFLTGIDKFIHAMSNLCELMRHVWVCPVDDQVANVVNLTGVLIDVPQDVGAQEQRGRAHGSLQRNLIWHAHSNLPTAGTMMLQEALLASVQLRPFPDACIAALLTNTQKLWDLDQVVFAAGLAWYSVLAKSLKSMNNEKMYT